LSGANGLMMEIVFGRQLLLSLGVTHYSVATVLTVFMVGLALGSFLFGRMADKIEYPVKLYGLLEVGVGLSGLLLITIFPYLDLFYVKLHLVFGTTGSTNILLKFLPAAIVLLIPTTLMGGTLPLIGKVFANENHSAGSPLGLLYGVNTFGIILAAFLCGIALGSSLVSRFADRLKRPVMWLGSTQFLIAGTAFAASVIMFRLRGLTGWLTLHVGESWDRFITAEMAILFALLLAPTFCMGAVFPLVMTVCVKTYKKLGQSVGNAYMLNTLGSILGAYLAGFIFIPYLGIMRGLKLTILISILGGAIPALPTRAEVEQFFNQI
jgi:MFS family permease